MIFSDERENYTFDFFFDLEAQMGSVLDLDLFSSNSLYLYDFLICFFMKLDSYLNI